MLASTRDHLDIIQFLVENCADIHQVNKDGWTCLQIAVREGFDSIVAYFLDIDIRLAFAFKTKNGRTPAHTACLHGRLSVLQLLLESSDRISGDSNKSKGMLDVRDSCGMTPFNEAILADHVEIVQHLIDNYQVFT